MKNTKTNPFLCSLLILYSFLKASQCIYTQIDSYTVYLNHIYKINPLAAHNGIIANLNWDDNSTVLNVYFHNSYQNAINNVNMQYSGYDRAKNTIGTYIVTYDNVVTSYYLSVKIIRQSAGLVGYNLNISTTSPYSMYSYRGWFSNLSGLTQQFAIPLSKYTNSQQSYRFSINTTTPQNIIALLGNDRYANKSFTIASNQSFCMPLDNQNANRWVIAFAGNISSKTDVQVYKFILYSDFSSSNCSTCTVLDNWDINNYNCDNFMPLSNVFIRNIGVIIGVSVGGGIFLIILVVIIIVLCRKCRYKDIVVPASPILTRKSSDTQQNLYIEDEKKYNYCNNVSIDESAECPICLQKKCSVLLLCSHALHKHCIDSWMKRDNKCPICRTDLARKTML